MKDIVEGDDVATLLQILRLEEREPGVYVGETPRTNRQRVFGGQVAGQALLAAELDTSNDWPVHSLHSYFLRPGDPHEEIRYTVDRIRDGRSFSTRRVLGSQTRRGEDVAIFALTADFHRPEPAGVTHSLPMPDVPSPAESFDPGIERRRGDAESLLMSRAVEQRMLDDPAGQLAPPSSDTRTRSWFRVAGRLPDDPTVHAAALTFVSDLTLLTAALNRVGGWQPRYQGSSLDHAVWFHAPMRADEWFLYETDSPVAAGSRALCFGQIWTGDGRHVATTAQEGLVRDLGE